MRDLESDMPIGGDAEGTIEGRRRPTELKQEAEPAELSERASHPYRSSHRSCPPDLHATRTVEVSTSDAAHFTPASAKGKTARHEVSAEPAPIPFRTGAAAVGLSLIALGPPRRARIRPNESILGLVGHLLHSKTAKSRHCPTTAPRHRGPGSK